MWRENVHRLKRWNRRFAGWRYYHHGDDEHAPELPVLLTEGGGTELYRDGSTTRRPIDDDPPQSMFPVGSDLDRDGYYSVIEPDYHEPGELWQAPNGGVFVKVETPL